MRDLTVSMTSKCGHCFTRAPVLTVRRDAFTRRLCQIQKAVHDLSRRRASDSIYPILITRCFRLTCTQNSWALLLAVMSSPSPEP